MEEDLCALFHQQALNASSGLLFQRVGRSEAGVRLREGGKRSLPGMVAFIERQEHDPDFDFSDMRGVWGFLFGLIRQDVDPNGATISVMDTAGWIKWAKAHSET